KAGTIRTETTGLAVLGLFGESASSVFGVGTGELILHFDGKGWAREHAMPSAKRHGMRDHLLYSAFYVPDESKSQVVAFGPQLVLERQADAAWTRLPEAEQDRLSLLAEAGPSDRPARCDREWWFWLGRDFAWFSCRDRRTFIHEADKTIPKGLRPSS